MTNNRGAIPLFLLVVVGIAAWALLQSGVNR